MNYIKAVLIMHMSFLDTSTNCMDSQNTFTVDAVCKEREKEVKDFFTCLKALPPELKSLIANLLLKRAEYFKFLRKLEHRYSLECWDTLGIFGQGGKTVLTWGRASLFSLWDTNSGVLLKQQGYIAHEDRLKEDLVEAFGYPREKDLSLRDAYSKMIHSVKASCSHTLKEGAFPIDNEKLEKQICSTLKKQAPNLPPDAQIIITSLAFSPDVKTALVCFEGNNKKNVCYIVGSYLLEKVSKFENNDRIMPLGAWFIARIRDTWEDRECPFDIHYGSLEEKIFLVLPQDVRKHLKEQYSITFVAPTIYRPKRVLVRCSIQ